MPLIAHGAEGAAAGPAHPPGSDRAWDALFAEVVACRSCRLGELRTRPAFYRGVAAPLVVFVGESPGAEEDRQGVPFVGRAGRRLSEGLERIGLGPGETGFLNLIKCRPPENRFDPVSARACRGHLDRQLELLRPTLVVPLGARALAAFDPRAPPVTGCAGRERTADGRSLFPLLHPAAPLHNPRLRARWEADLTRLGTAVASLRRAMLKHDLRS